MDEQLKDDISYVVNTLFASDQIVSTNISELKSNPDLQYISELRSNSELQSNLELQSNSELQSESKLESLPQLQINSINPNNSINSIPLSNSESQSYFGSKFNMEMIDKSRIAVLGHIDAGKSSFIGVMVNNELDDGRGSARSKTTRIKHELKSGRTSNFHYNYITNITQSNNSPKELITLIDLCGHEKYLKTTLFGVSGLFVDFAIVIVGANMGIGKMTKEHILILHCLKIPFIVVITKIDIAPKEIYKKTRDDLTLFLKKKALDKMPIYIEKEQEKLSDKTFLYIKSMNDRQIRIVPVICVSNTKGHNINFIKQFIINLESPSYLSYIKNEITNIPQLSTSITDKAIFFLDSCYNVKGIGIVFSGNMREGKIRIGNTMYLGPFGDKFIPIQVKSIHNSIRENITCLNSYQSGSIGIRLVNKKDIFDKSYFKKGLIIIDDPSKVKNNIVKKFMAKIIIFHHSTSIKNAFQTVIHCGTVRQSARIIISDNIYLRSGDRAEVEFELFKPEFIEVGKVILIRNGLTKGMGIVTQCL